MIVIQGCLGQNGGSDEYLLEMMEVTGKLGASLAGICRRFGPTSNQSPASAFGRASTVECRHDIRLAARTGDIRAEDLLLTVPVLSSTYRPAT